MKADWIPLEERLPEVGDEVVTLSIEGYKTVARWMIPFGGFSAQWIGPGMMLLSEGITHWLPLPKHPEEK